MFTILGADGKEYGPVTADKIHEWINGGRANLQTKARRVEDTEWKFLGEFPEFAGTTTPAAARTSFEPAAAAPAALGVEALAGRAGTLDIGACIKRGFASGAKNFWPILGVGLLVGLGNGVIGAIPILGFIATFTLTGVFYGGLYYYILKRLRAEPTSVGDAFSGFSVCFGQLVLATLVVMILTIIGFICLILPGIYLAVCWVFTYALVRDKGLPFWDAMELGRQVITRQWFRVFGLFLLLGLAAMVVMGIPVGMVIASGVAAQSSGATPNFVLLGLGIMGTVASVLVIAPFFAAIMMEAYEDLFGDQA